jgi:uncharacterized protein
MTDSFPFTAVFTQISEQHPTLKLLVLFGSRARGDHDHNSDWDIAFLFDLENAERNSSSWFPGADLLPALSNLGQIPSDLIDLLDLSTCSDIMAHFVAQYGHLLYERNPGQFHHFRQHALKAPAELKQFRQIQRNKVLQALQRWGA